MPLQTLQVCHSSSRTHHSLSGVTTAQGAFVVPKRSSSERSCTFLPHVLLHQRRGTGLHREHPTLHGNSTRRQPSSGPNEASCNPVGGISTNTFFFTELSCRTAHLWVRSAVQDHYEVLIYHREDHSSTGRPRHAYHQQRNTGEKHLSQTSRSVWITCAIDMDRK